MFKRALKFGFDMGQSLPAGLKNVWSDAAWLLVRHLTGAVIPRRFTLRGNSSLDLAPRILSYE
jgi:hypothetical protein